MEKMNGDMLEMILSNENSRLTERTTKFMIYQVTPYNTVVLVIRNVALYMCGVSARVYQAFEVIEHVLYVYL